MRNLWMVVGFIVLLIAAAILYAGLAPVPPDLPTGQPQPDTHELEKCTPKVSAATAVTQTITVAAGEKIQDAVDRANPGDTILVSPGVYNQSVLVSTKNITLRGMGEDAGRPVLDGGNSIENGVDVCGDHFTIENIVVRNYKGNGVLAQNVDGVTFRNVMTDHTGDYGLFPVNSKNILIDHCVATGAADTGLYVGQSENIIVRDNEAFANVSGIEIENSSNALVERNYSHDNTDGLLVFLLPDLSRKETTDNIIRNNRFIANNLANFGDPADIVAKVPAGTGMLIMGADRTEVTGNEIRDNRSVGIATVGLRTLFDTRKDFDVGTEPEGNWVHDNVLQNNGTNPTPEALRFGLPAADLVWDGSGWDNAWHESVKSTFPPVLPDRGWSDFARRFYWRVLGVARKFM
ncbi:MAG: parallel beta-helix domain-containing protein [Anaerolineae bacterium]